MMNEGSDQPAGTIPVPERVISASWLITVRAQAPILAITLWYAAAASLLAACLGFGKIADPTLYFSPSAFGFVAIGMQGLVIGYLLYVAIFVRPRRPVLHIVSELKRSMTTERLLTGAVTLGVMPIFYSAWTGFKTLIPVLNRYEWDTKLAMAGWWLQGGHNAFEILQRSSGIL
jgi:hypothetical protein